MNYKNPTFNADGTIDMEIEHPVHGPIPFTASPDDPEERGRLLFADAQASAAPYVSPLPALAQRKKDVDAQVAVQRRVLLLPVRRQRVSGHVLQGRQGRR